MLIDNDSNLELYYDKNSKRIYYIKEYAIENLELIKKIISIRDEKIQSIIGFEVDENKIYVKCEYANGMDLNMYCQENSILINKKMIIKLYNDLISIIYLLKDKDLVHRDIKPSNIIIDKYGNFTLIDFGISRINKKFQENDTELFVSKGFSSPEQFGHNQTDYKSDLYSLGKTMEFLYVYIRDDNEIKSIIDRLTSLDPNKRIGKIKNNESQVNKKEHKLLSNFVFLPFKTTLFNVLLNIFSYAMAISVLYDEFAVSYKNNLLILSVFFSLVFFFLLKVINNANNKSKKNSIKTLIFIGNFLLTMFILVGVLLFIDSLI